MKTYFFDIKMFLSVQVQAESEDDAQAAVKALAQVIQPTTMQLAGINYSLPYAYLTGKPRPGAKIIDATLGTDEGEAFKPDVLVEVKE